MTFLQPGYLLLAFVVIVPWIRRSSTKTHAAIRSLALLWLVLALARPALLQDASEDAVHVVIHEAEQAEWVRARSWQGRVALESEGSLSEALENALRKIPAGDRGSITLIGAGASADRHWGEAVRACQERGLPIHALAASAERPSARVLSLTETQPLRVGQSATMQVNVLGMTPGTEVRLIDERDARVLATGTVTGDDSRAQVPLTFEPEQSGFLTLRVECGESSLRKTVGVEDPLRALYLGARWQEGEQSLQRLLGNGVHLEKGRVPLPELSGVDLVVIDDLPASQLVETDQERLRAEVRDHGLGLFVSGGMAAFGPGGYEQTPLAKSLPVEFMQKEEKRDPSTALAVIIDTSGSMGGERVQLAKEVARLAIRRLLPHDKVGIVEFYGTKQWAAPLQSAANAIDIQRALNRLDAGGGTVIMPAIEEAYYALLNVQTRYKHVLVLTDGGVEAGEFEPLLRKMAAKGMNVSTVLVGGNAHSEFLVNLANWGKGHFYSASNRFSIPEILLKQPSTSKIPAYRPGIHVVDGRGAAGWWGEVPRASLPPLAGYVETRPREGAEVLLETQANKHPVLATWKDGLGRVTALMTEPVGKGTAPWESWENYGQWLGRVMARTAREERRPFHYEVTRRRHEVWVRATRRMPSATEPQATKLVGTERIPIQFTKRSPEVHTARLVVAPDEELRVLAGQEPALPLVSNKHEDSVSPAHQDPDKFLDLSLLAEETGGQFRKWEPALAFVPAAGGQGDAYDILRLWNLCLLLALLTYLADIVYRRWPTRERS